MNFSLYFQLLISPLFVCVVSQKAFNSKSNLILGSLKFKDIILTKFLNQLSNQHFAHCSLLFLQDSYNHGAKINVILENSKFLPKYVAKHTNHENPFIHSFLFKISNTRQHSDRCMITITFLFTVDSKFLEDFRTTFSPTFKQLIRMDFDYFVFVTDVDNHEKLLNLRILYNRYKFKIVVGVNKQTQLVLTTVDFFGGLRSTPKIFRIKSTEELTKNKKSIFPDFTENMRGYTMRVVLPIAVSLVEATPPPWIETNNGKRGRWLFLITEYLMDKLNFTYRLFGATGKDGRFGTGGTGLMLPNGTWIGITGDLLYRRADMGLVVAQTDQRIEYIGYTDQNSDRGALTFVTGQPTEVYSVLALLWPFRIDLWASIVMSTIISILFAILLTKRLQKFGLEVAQFGLSSQVSLLLTPFLEQGAPKIPLSSSLRSFTALWLFFSLIITNLYRSQLLTLLAFPVFDSLPETFEQLAFSDFKIGFMKDGDSAYVSLTRGNDPVYKELIKKMEIHYGVNLNCMEKVVTEKKYACIAYDWDVDYLIQRNFSDAKARKLKISSAQTYNIWMGLATESQSIFRVTLGNAISQTLPFNMPIIWAKQDLYKNVKLPKLDWWRETNQTEFFTHIYEDGETTLKIANLAGVFYVYLGCVLGCSLTFCYEMHIKIVTNKETGENKYLIRYKAFHVVVGVVSKIFKFGKSKRGRLIRQ